MQPHHTPGMNSRGPVPSALPAEHGMMADEEVWIGRVISCLNDSLLAFPAELEGRLRSIRQQALEARLSEAKRR